MVVLKKEPSGPEESFDGSQGKHDRITKMRRVWELHDQEKYKEAIQCLDKILETDPHDLDALNAKAVVLGDMGKRDQAIECCDRALAIDPKDHAIHTNKGAILYTDKRFAEALECYDKAIAIDPNNYPAYCNKGELLYKRRKFAEALECYDKALAIDPKGEFALIGKGDAQVRMKIKSEGASKPTKNGIKTDCPICRVPINLFELTEYEIDEGNPVDADFLDYQVDPLDIKMTKKAYAKLKTHTGKARTITAIIAKVEHHKDGLVGMKCRISGRVFKVFFYSFVDHKRKEAGRVTKLVQVIPMS